MWNFYWGQYLITEETIGGVPQKSCSQNFDKSFKKQLRMNSFTVIFKNLIIKDRLVMATPVNYNIVSKGLHCLEFHPVILSEVTSVLQFSWIGMNAK